MKRHGFFCVEKRPIQLIEPGNQLETFSQAVGFKIFRPDMNTTLPYSDNSKSRRPPFDLVLMFNILAEHTERLAVNTQADTDR